MTLAEQLQAQLEQAVANVPPEAMEVLKASGEKLVESGLAEASIREGEQFPEHELKDALGNTRQLGDILANGPTILTFYRGGW